MRIVLDMNDRQAEEIARNFLSQHHDVHNIKVVGSKNGIWSVEAEVYSSSGECVRKLRIDGKTRKIISVE
jgi:hypothetical protein